MDDANIGERIRELRTLMGWSQRDLAEESDTNPDTVSNIEAGRHVARPSTLRKLANALGVDVADFYREVVLPKDNVPTSNQSTEDILDKEEIEAGPIVATLDAFGAYTKNRLNIYKDELDDPNSPHFRNATAAALWAEILDRELSMLYDLLLGDLLRVLYAPIGESVAVTKAVQRISKNLMDLYRVLSQAIDRIADMHSTPDALAQQRSRQIRQGLAENKQRFEQLQKAAEA